MSAGKNQYKILKMFLTLVVFGWGVGGLNSVAWSAGTKIGFVNIQKAMFATKEYKRASAKFKSNYEKEKGLINAREKKIKRMLEDLSKQGFVMSLELKKKKEASYRKEKKKFERYVQDQNEEFARKEKEATAKILKKMLKVLEKIGKDKKFTMILEKKSVFYSDISTDVTKLATTTYDKVNR